MDIRTPLIFLLAATNVFAFYDARHSRHIYDLATGSHVMAAVYDGKRVLYIGNSQNAYPTVPGGKVYYVEFATPQESRAYIARHGTNGRWVELTP